MEWRRCVREKYVPHGGPDGGDGGRGGHIYLLADASINTLLQFRENRFEAVSGSNGGTARRHGADGRDVTIKVPLARKYVPPLMEYRARSIWWRMGSACWLRVVAKVAWGICTLLRRPIKPHALLSLASQAKSSKSTSS
jgi:hypothetical protein